MAGLGQRGNAAWLPAKRREYEAKRAWIAKLDAPTWGKAAATLGSTLCFFMFLSNSDLEHFFF